MSAVINTNIASLNAQRNLSGSQSAMQTALQRLSSGLRINSAKDDAAGLAISERFTSQINGLNQAVRNANDGVSLAQTGEAALGEITNNLQRIRELAVQSANATNSTSDRDAINLEVEELLAEIDRTSTQTTFNGQKILDGTFGNATFQVGANAGNTIALNLTSSTRTSDIGAIATATSTGYVAATGGSAAVPAVANASGSAGVFTTSVAAAAGQTYSITVDGVTAFTFTSAAGADDVTAAEIDTYITNTSGANLTAAGITKGGTAAGGNLTFTRADGTAFDIVVTNTMATTPGGFAGADFAAGTNNVDNGTEAVAEVSAGALTMVTGDMTIQVGDGTAVDMAGSYTTAQDLADAINNNVSGAYASVTTGGEITLSSAQALTVGGATGTTTLGFSATAIAADNGTLKDDVSVNTAAAANLTILRIDSALTSVSSLRSSFGAIQNRFESVTTSLSTTSENLSAARSRIQDADFASETAALTRAQILQQAGTAMLAQANSLPNSVLTLLQG